MIIEINAPGILQYVEQNWDVIIGVVCVLLLLDRRRLIKELKRRNAHIDRIVDNYHSGNITISESMNALKMALIEMRNRR